MAPALRIARWLAGIAIALAGSGCANDGDRRHTPASSSSPAPHVALRPPFDTVVLGQRVRDLDTTWVGAFLLSDVRHRLDSLGADTAELARRDIEPMLGVTVDLNDDGFQDSVLAGVYRTAVAQGRFLLILRQVDDTTWVRSGVVTWPDPAPMTYLLFHEQGLIWSDCLACDSYAAIQFVDGRYELVFETCCDVDGHDEHFDEPDSALPPTPKKPPA